MRRSHNTSWPDGLVYRGASYAGPHALHAAADPVRRVSEQCVTTRLNRRRAAGAVIDDVLIDECLYLSPTEYKSRHGVRITWVEIDGVRTNAAPLYDRLGGEQSYSTFRQRLLRLQRSGLLDLKSATDAACLPADEWRSYYGGGRRKSFVYLGEDYPEQYGRRFSSITAFLRTCGAYDLRGHVWDRLHKGWSLDSAIREPVLPSTERTGRIYCATQRSTGKSYVGLTIGSMSARWSQHISHANAGAGTAFAQALRADGAYGFELRVLEEGLSWEALAERERHWIEALDTLSPRGLNSSAGGQVGGGKRKPVIVDGERFHSIENASHTLSARTGLAPHVIESRLRQGKSLPAKARTHSKHPEAGSTHWRRWQGLLKRGEVCENWRDYDQFARDTPPTDAAGKELSRLDDSLPWGRGNVRWMTRAERVAASTGRSVIVDGVPYPSFTALAEAKGLGVSTLKERLKAGATLEEAVSRPLGPTSRKGKPPLIVDGKSFASLHAASIYVSETYGLTQEMARDRLRRNRPLASSVGRSVK